MSNLLACAPAVHPGAPPRSIAESDRPLDGYIADLAAHFLALGTDRGLLVAEHLQELAREVRCCTTPGRPLGVEEFRERRECIRESSDGELWPPIGSWVDIDIYSTVDEWPF